jgi:hypothetical protein
MKKLVSFLAMGIALQYSFGSVIGCSSDPSPRKATTPIGKRGTLSMALQTVSDSGKVYRLRNATFFVSTGFFFPGAFDKGSGISQSPIQNADGGPIGSVGAGGSIGVFPDAGFGGFGDGGFFPGGGSAGFPAGGSVGFPNQIILSSEEDPTEPVIERFLSPGSYNIQLFDGWFVEQVDNLLHTSSPVPATLLSSNFQFFDIESDKETFVKFNFEVDGRRVTFGPPGRAIIGIGIHETQGEFCGNGVAEGSEDCDGKDMRGATCASVTMGARPNGTLFCNFDCLFDTTFCQGGGGFDGGTGGFGTGGVVGTGGVTGGAGKGGGVGFPDVDGGAANGAGGVPGKPPSP